MNKKMYAVHRCWHKHTFASKGHVCLCANAFMHLLIHIPVSYSQNCPLLRIRYHPNLSPLKGVVTMAHFSIPDPPKAPQEQEAERHSRAHHCCRRQRGGRCPGQLCFSDIRVMCIDSCFYKLGGSVNRGLGLLPRGLRLIQGKCTAGCFCKLEGVPCCGCPSNKSLIVLWFLLGPLIFGTSHIDPEVMM